MDSNSLAERLVKKGWLGRPRVKWYEKSTGVVCFVSIMRMIPGVLFLTDPKLAELDEGSRYRFMALCALSILVAFTDWIPYRFYTWQRRPTILMRWATPASGAASILVNAVLLLTAPTNGLRRASILSLAITFGEAALTNIAFLYFVWYGPIKLPSIYEPVCKSTGQDQEGDGLSSSYSSGGQLATLYIISRSSNRDVDTGDVRTERPQPARRPVSVSSSLDGKKSANKIPLTGLWKDYTGSRHSKVQPYPHLPSQKEP